MKHKIAIAVVVITLILQGCGAPDNQASELECTATISDNNDFIDNGHLQGNNLNEVERLNLFYAFVEGEVSYQEGDDVYFIYNDVVDTDGVFYTFYDINKDGKCELNIKTPRSYYVLNEKEGTLYMMFRGTGYDELLNDGTIFATLHLAGPDHYIYIHTEFSVDEECSEIVYECYDENHDLIYDDKDLYLIDGKQVDYDDFQSAVNGIQSIGNEAILWRKTEKTGGR